MSALFKFDMKEQNKDRGCFGDPKWVSVRRK